MRSFQRYEVGDRFTDIMPRIKLPDTDSSFLEFSKDHGFIFLVFLHDITVEEEELLYEGRIFVRVLNKGNLYYFLFQFGSNNLIFEASFNPALYQDDRCLYIKKGSLVNMFATDLKDGRVKVIRIFTLPSKMYQLLGDLAREVDENYTDRYLAWQQGLMQYSVLDLWNRAQYIGKIE